MLSAQAGVHPRASLWNLPSLHVADSFTQEVNLGQYYVFLKVCQGILWVLINPDAISVGVCTSSLADYCLQFTRALPPVVEMGELNA